MPHRRMHGGRSARAHLTALARSNRIPLPLGRVDEVLQEVGLAEDGAAPDRGGFSLGMKQRLGIASALLGEPPVLLFDEPLNGLDPEGVKWVRGLFHRMAAEGRTVFVSSHLMSADIEHRAPSSRHGPGHVDPHAEAFREFHGRADSVRVRSPQLDLLQQVLTDAGIAAEDDQAASALVVRGAASEVVGELAAKNGITLHELSSQHGSLEEAYMKLTDDAVQYRAAT